MDRKLIDEECQMTKKKKYTKSCSTSQTTKEIKTKTVKDFYFRFA